MGDSTDAFGKFVGKAIKAMKKDALAFDDSGEDTLLWWRASGDPREAKAAPAPAASTKTGKAGKK